MPLHWGSLGSAWGSRSPRLFTVCYLPLCQAVKFSTSLKLLLPGWEQEWGTWVKAGEVGRRQEVCSCPSSSTLECATSLFHGPRAPRLKHRNLNRRVYKVTRLCNSHKKALK